ncbi:AP-3 complex subunit beta [Aspergillus glaucus CBS 516.65]|uniref:Clathrin/coatomer adaptor adaptin-like N-terminal domain-containing protein n=1 Tax=Aspergillus glaucus CBS 516.65 TaxID=1160497 RepID=A0A1L9V6M9_ASPGL|nr:hypothetical protein ASPGLDRAFT_77569 [Aspergillus glaucus CBS 516.65]OJJ79529.1 hypothetical protein ASPGLDRAFT_77569 [Aspergillus glaucus CBS 516.65]
METISRISSMLETARELTLEAAQSATSNRTSNLDSSSRNSNVPHIKKLLDSRHEQEVLDGLRKVISSMYEDPELSLEFFSAVVKNAASTSFEVKKLVYVYLVHHAEAEPDLALLSINAIQKSLTDTNPQVRAMALRTMSGISVPVINQIVCLAIKRGVGDMSPHVRKAAALAIPKCYRLEPSTISQLIGYISTLLGDGQYFVAGPAVAAFLEVCPDRIDLVHKHYRSLVKKLVDMDEWSQLATLRLLTSYARKCFPLKTQKVKRAVTKGESKGFYDDEEVAEGQNDGEEYEVPVLDPDLEVFLRTCKSLLQNRNSAVILGVVRSFAYLAPPEYLNSAVGPLVALLRSPQDIQHIALYNVVSVALRHPKPFAKYISHYLVHSTDPPHIWRLKLEILTIIFSHCGLHLKSVIISELEHFSRSTDRDLVRESVRAIGRCAQSDTRTANHCLRVLLNQITSFDDTLVSESLTVIRHLIQHDPASHERTVIQLVKYLGSTTCPDARATIVWLVGEFAGVEPERNVAPDVLRLLVKGFADEPELVKQQLVLLGAKVYLHHLLRNPPKDQAPPVQKVEQYSNEWTDDQEKQKEQGDDEQKPQEELEEDNITILWRYILLLARYDTSYDLRDRARLYKALLASPTTLPLANLLLLAPKPVPYAPSPSETRKELLIGSSTLVLGPDAGFHGLKGYEKLPDWVAPGDEPAHGLRDQGVVKPEVSEGASLTAGERLDRALKEHDSVAAVKRQNDRMQGPTPAKQKSLNEWLEDEEEESETETEEETDSEEETGSEEEETDSEEEDDEEEEEETDSEDDREGQQLLRQRDAQPGPSRGL